MTADPFVCRVCGRPFVVPSLARDHEVKPHDV